MACVVLVKCPAAVPCATADEESGSNLKLGSVWINPTCQDNCFENPVLSNKPMHEKSLSAN